MKLDSYIQKCPRSRNFGKSHLSVQMPEVRVVLRAPRNYTGTRESAPAGDLITPIQRGLAVLASFRVDDDWLGNQEIALRTAIPKATVTRLTQTLTCEGFLNHSPQLRKYRLAPAVLGLGYATIDNAEMATVARPLMQKLADECGVFVSLAGRDGLDIVLIENCHSATTLTTLALSAGARLPIISSPLGLALLSGLPEVERNYLVDRIRLRFEPEYRVKLRQRAADAVAQVSQKGYCVSVGDWGADLVVAAAPLHMADRPPVAIACAGPAKSVTRARLSDLIGPRLVDLVHTLEALPTQCRDQGATQHA